MERIGSSGFKVEAGTSIVETEFVGLSWSDYIGMGDQSADTAADNTIIESRQIIQGEVRLPAIQPAETQALIL